MSRAQEVAKLKELAEKAEGEEWFVQHAATEDGLRRKPVLWRFAADFFALFQKANAAATAKRLSVARRALPPVAPLVAKKDAYRWDLLLGEQPPSPLDAKLAELGRGVFGSAERLAKANSRKFGGPET